MFIAIITHLPVIFAAPDRRTESGGGYEKDNLDGDVGSDGLRGSRGCCTETQ
jgi:hypothetical protein